MANKQVLNEDILALLFSLLDMSLYLPIPKRSKKLYKAAAKDYKSLHQNFRSIFPDLKTGQQRQLHKKVMKDLDALGKEFKNLLKQVNKDYDSDKASKKKKWDSIKEGYDQTQKLKAYLSEAVELVEAKFTKVHAKKAEDAVKGLKGTITAVPHKDKLYINYTNWNSRAKIAKAVVDKLGVKYNADGRSTNAPKGILGLGGANWMEFVNEGKLNEISVKAGFDDIKKGRTTAIDGVKMSKDMVAAIMDWMAMSSYGRKYHKQIMKGSIHSLLKPADAWGIERFLKSGKLKKEWKAIIKKHKPKKEGVNEQSQFFGPDKVTPPKRKIDKRILNVPIYDETPEEVDARRARITQKNLEQDRITNLKDELGGSFGPFVKKDSWAHKINQAINVGELDPSSEDWGDHSGQWKSHVEDMEGGIDPTTYTLGKDSLEEGVPFPQKEPNEFAFFDFKKWAYKNRGKLKKELLKHKDNPGKLWNKLCDIWVEWAKKTNNKDFSRITDKQKFGRALAIMLKKQNVLFAKNSSPSHKITVKEQLDKKQLQMYVDQNPNIGKKNMKNIFKDMNVTPSDTLLFNTSQDSQMARNMGNFDFTNMIAKNKGAVPGGPGVNVTYDDREPYDMSQSTYNTKDGYTHVSKSKKQESVNEILDRIIVEEAVKIYKERKLDEQGLLKVANFIKKTVKPLIDKFTGDKEEPEAIDIEKTDDRWYEPKPEPTDSVVDIMIKKEIKEQMTPSQVKFLSGKLKLKKGDKITYDQHFQFGKVSKNVTAKVVAVKGHTVFLDKGPELDLRTDPINKLNGKAIK